MIPSQLRIVSLGPELHRKGPADTPIWLIETPADIRGADPDCMISQRQVVPCIALDQVSDTE